jgi:transposase-like protein
VFTELKNRGLDDVLMLVGDGLKGLPEAVETVWPRTIVQTCVVHLLRDSFRYAARQDWDKVAKALRPVYTAPSEDAATERFLEFQEAWGQKYPAIVKLWSDAWSEFVPFLSFDVEIRKVVCSTNAIERQRPHPQGRPRPRTLPRRGRRFEVPLDGPDEPGPGGQGPQAVDHALESTPKKDAFRIAFEGRLTPSNN